MSLRVDHDGLYGHTRKRYAYLALTPIAGLLDGAGGISGIENPAATSTNGVRANQTGLLSAHDVRGYISVCLHSPRAQTQLSGLVHSRGSHLL